jgi:hypothetical protein
MHTESDFTSNRGSRRPQSGLLLWPSEHSGYDVRTSAELYFRIHAIFLRFPRSHQYCANTTAIDRPDDCAEALQQGPAGTGVGHPMAINLHRMLGLALLCVGLFVASGPAIACCAQGTTTQDCCPSRSHEIRSQSDLIGSPSASQSCCAVAAQTAMGTASHVMPSKAEHQAGAPFSLIYLATLSTTDTGVWVGVSYITPTSPALSPVYLRTGRLRL